MINCMSCEIEIPPMWKTCLAENKCPSCGKEIMDNALQELIAGLSEALEKMPNNPQGIACWLVSNYKLNKIGDYEPPQFHEPKSTQQVPLEIRQQKLNEFFKRAEVSPGTRKAPPQIKAPDEDMGDIEEDVIGDEVDDMMFGNTGGSISEQEKRQIEDLVVKTKFGAEKNPVIAAMMEAQRIKQDAVEDGVGYIKRS